MDEYQVSSARAMPPQTIYLIANGDLRLTANQAVEWIRLEMESNIISILESETCLVARPVPLSQEKGHALIDSPELGRKVFDEIPSDAPVIVLLPGNQYIGNVLPGLYTHSGPILLLSAWTGKYGGHLGMIDLHGALAHCDAKVSKLWTATYDDPLFQIEFRRWVRKGKVRHEEDFMVAYKKTKIPGGAEKAGKKFLKEFRKRGACIGTVGAAAPGEEVTESWLNMAGFFRQPLGQAALLAEMQTVSDHDTRNLYEWLWANASEFHLGASEQHDLTEGQLMDQCRVTIATARLAAFYGCDGVGISYDIGIEKLIPSTALTEAMLNSSQHAPLTDQEGKAIFAHVPLPAFPGGDPLAGVDATLTSLLWRALGFPPETGTYQPRWGEFYKDAEIDEHVWVFLGVGGVPPAHFSSGWKDAVGDRQPATLCPRGGSTINGLCKPGWIVWSCFSAGANGLMCDIGMGEAVALPDAETETRHQGTLPEWPIMHTIMSGITRDQLLARFRSSRFQVAYAPGKSAARRALYAKASVLHELGFEVSFCGKP